MNPGLATTLYLVVLCAASAAWQFGPRRSRNRPFRPVATAAVLIIIAVPSLLQLTIAPGMLLSMERSGVSTGIEQPWRLVTALLVQDGGWAGMAFNLTTPVRIGLLAELVWGAGH
ncbi:hypothetical protein DQ353_06780 [Arthrobacter sp. AQ5-05]|uniref:hypothetical protein n=1 Tax=Arthrobacter sp. AQ5-05 TaxID=2184581 RepID=UPI000DCDC3E8|nr:hypothetical protein [Arthrobacter sp. AQ5-05]RAX49865.1 hypothetical protein DQ353_06780 [Arthrobacter sp. AQ5-05]